MSNNSLYLNQAKKLIEYYYNDYFHNNFLLLFRYFVKLKMFTLIIFFNYDDSMKKVLI